MAMAEVQLSSKGFKRPEDIPMTELNHPFQLFTGVSPIQHHWDFYPLLLVRVIDWNKPKKRMLIRG
jgi:hypothetical protein